MDESADRLDKAKTEEDVLKILEEQNKKLNLARRMETSIDLVQKKNH